MLGGQPHVSFCLPLIRRPDIHLQISESPGQKCRFKMGKVIEHPRNYKAVLLWFDYTTSAVLFQVPFPGSRRNFFKMPPRSRPRFSLLFGRGRRFRFCSVAGHSFLFCSVDGCKTFAVTVQCLHSYRQKSMKIAFGNGIFAYNRRAFLRSAQ